MKRVVLITLLLAPQALGQVVTASQRGVVFAHQGRVQLVNGWSARGVAQATHIVASADRVAVLDALNNEAAIVELASGRATMVKTAETPIDAAFVGRQLYVLARDARTLQRIGGESIAVGADPAFLRESRGRLYVYSRAAGTIEEIDGDRVTRRAQVAPFASDMEIAGDVAYLAFPREARIRIVDLKTMKTSGTVAVGAVPVDLAFAGGGTAITARVLAVADPSSKRVWLTEGTQSTATAIARGFLRGFLGLGLFGSRSSQFPTGVDRVLTRGKLWVAYDSSSGTLYRFTKSKSSVIATGIAPHAFALTEAGIAIWKNGGISVAQENAK